MSHMHYIFVRKKKLWVFLERDDEKAIPVAVVAKWCFSNDQYRQNEKQEGEISKEWSHSRGTRTLGESSIFLFHELDKTVSGL